MSRPKLLRLVNPIQEYSWGSDTVIFDAFGWSQTGAPAAELWLGSHASAPSLVATRSGQTGLPVPGDTEDPEQGVQLDATEKPSFYRIVAAGSGGPDDSEDLRQNSSHRPLGEVVRAEPDLMLGTAVADEYGPMLPYLLKVLSAAQPLSLQVHPRPHVARAGFQRENAQGLAADSELRNYKDAFHKPEMLIALTQFEGLCGFRRPRRTLELLEGLTGRTVQAMRDILNRQPNAAGIRAAMVEVLELRNADCKAELDETIRAIERVIAGQRARGERVSRGHVTAIDLARQYPGDPGALVSLLLNRVSLQPGEAVYLAAGQIHAYLGGLGVEIMASSDNVLRAGLTPKRVDTAELMAATDFVPAAPIRPQLRAVPGGLTQYRSPAQEFSVLYGPVGGHALVTQSGPRIVLCLKDELKVRTGLGEELILGPGQSVFAPHGVGVLELIGEATAVVAYVP